MSEEYQQSEQQAQALRTQELNRSQALIQQNVIEQTRIQPKPVIVSTPIQAQKATIVPSNYVDAINRVNVHNTSITSIKPVISSTPVKVIPPVSSIMAKIDNSQNMIEQSRLKLTSNPLALAIGDSPQAAPTEFGRSDPKIRAGLETTLLKVNTAEYDKNVASYTTFIKDGNDALAQYNDIVKLHKWDEYDFSSYKSTKNGTGKQAYIKDMNDLKMALSTAPTDLDTYKKNFDTYTKSKTQLISSLQTASIAKTSWTLNYTDNGVKKTQIFNNYDDMQKFIVDINTKAASTLILSPAEGSTIQKFDTSAKSSTANKIDATEMQFKTPDELHRYIEGLSETQIKANVDVLSNKLWQLASQAPEYAQSNDLKVALDMLYPAFSAIKGQNGEYNPKGVLQAEAIIAEATEKQLSPFLNLLPRKADGSNYLFQVLPEQETFTYKDLEDRGLTPDKVIVGKAMGYATEGAEIYFTSMVEGAVLGFAYGAAGKLVAKIPAIGGLAERGGMALTTATGASLPSSILSTIKAGLTKLGIIDEATQLVTDEEGKVIPLTVESITTKAPTLTGQLKNAITIGMDKLSLGVTEMDTLNQLAAITQMPLVTIAGTAGLAAYEYDRLEKVLQTKGAEDWLGQFAVDSSAFLGGIKGFQVGFSYSDTPFNYIQMKLTKGQPLSAYEVAEANVIEGRAKYPGFEEQRMKATPENFKMLSVNYTPPELEQEGKVIVYSGTQDPQLVASLAKVGVTGGDAPLLWASHSWSTAFSGIGQAEEVALPSAFVNPFAKASVISIGIDDVTNEDFISKMDRKDLGKLYQDILDRSGQYVGVMPSEQGMESQIIIGPGQKFIKVGDQLWVNINGRIVPLQMMQPIGNAGTVTEDAISKIVNLDSGSSSIKANTMYIPTLNAVLSTDYSISATTGSIKLSTSQINDLSTIISSGKLSATQLDSAINALSAPTIEKLVDISSPEQVSKIYNSVPESVKSNLSERISSKIASSIKSVQSEDSISSIESASEKVSSNQVEKYISSVESAKSPSDISSISEVSNISEQSKISSVSETSEPSELSSISELSEPSEPSPSSQSYEEKEYPSLKLPAPAKPTDKDYADKPSKSISKFKVTYTFMDNENEKEVSARTFREALGNTWNKRGSLEIPKQVSIVKMPNVKSTNVLF